jgi:hypothetical protein
MLKCANFEIYSLCSSYFRWKWLLLNIMITSHVTRHGPKFCTTLWPTQQLDHTRVSRGSVSRDQNRMVTQWRWKIARTKNTDLNSLSRRPVSRIQTFLALFVKPLLTPFLWALWKKQIWVNKPSTLRLWEIYIERWKKGPNIHFSFDLEFVQFNT